jgi:hypothetical protein
MEEYEDIFYVKVNPNGSIELTISLPSVDDLKRVIAVGEDKLIPLRSPSLIPFTRIIRGHLLF